MHGLVVFNINCFGDCSIIQFIILPTSYTRFSHRTSDRSFNLPDNINRPEQVYRPLLQRVRAKILVQVPWYLGICLPYDELCQATHAVNFKQCQLPYIISQPKDGFM